MDRRKFNKGTIGNKGGRPPKADEVALIEQLDGILHPDEVWHPIAEKIKQGDIQAAKLWIEYRYGKAQQMLNIKQYDESMFSNLKVEIVNAPQQEDD